MSDLSLGIAAAVGPEFAARIAPAAEAAGMRTLWVNDTPGHDALELLAAAAQVTSRLRLATGVIPVDRRPGAEILTRLAALDLPADRLTLGIGSGSGAVGALARVAEAARVLRDGTTARVVVGALGPKMRALGARASDGLLLSWLTPDAARQQTVEAHRAASASHVALYVRAATDPEASARLDVETGRYAGYPAYSANFARLGFAARDTVIRPETPGADLARYADAADEVVLRAITAEDDVEDYLAFIDTVGAAGR